MRGGFEPIPPPVTDSKSTAARGILAALRGEKQISTSLRASCVGFLPTVLDRLAGILGYGRDLTAVLAERQPCGQSPLGLHALS